MVLSVSCWESFVSRAMLTFLPHAFWLVQLCLVFHTCCQIISAPKLFCYSLFAMLLPHLCCRPPAKPPDSFCFHSSSWASSQASRGILCLESSFTTGSPQNSSILVVGIQAGPKNRTFTPNHPYLCIESRHPHIFTVSCALFAFRLKALVTAVDFHWLHTLPDFFFLKLNSATKRLHHMATLESLHFTTGLQEVNINKGTVYLLFICLDDGKINLFWTPGLRFAAGGRVALCTVCA